MSWIAGNEGTEKLVPLISSLQNRLVEVTSKNRGIEFKYYAPWMSSSLISETFDPNFFRCQNELVITDQQCLEYLRKQYDLHREPLLYVKEENEGQIVIWTDIESQNLDAKNYISQSWSLVESTYEWLKTLMKVLIKHVIPITPLVPVKGICSISSHLSFGNIYLGLPDDCDECSIIDLAISIGHEIGHHALFTYQFGSKILEKGYHLSAYSGVRKTYRPIMMAFHACVALYYMSLVSQALSRNSQLSHKGREYAGKQFKVMQNNLTKGLKPFEKVPLSDIGLKIYEEMQSLEPI